MTDRRTFLVFLTTAAVGRTAEGTDGTGWTEGKSAIDAEVLSASEASVEADSARPRKNSPWGIATSHSRSLDLGWLPSIGATGISSLRGLNESAVDASLEAALADGFEVSGILHMGSTFPADDLDGWEAWVTALVEEAAGRVTHWEVWNEPPNFSTDKSPESYAALVNRAYDVVKRIDPKAQVGICAASVHLNFLERALLAGAASRFDYVTLHPYETMSVLDRGFEPLFLAIVPTVRKMLRASSPTRSEVPILFTEVGRPVLQEITPELQADALVKVYALSIAQGVTRVHWFEGVDGDSGPFGLIAGDGTRRPAYYAAQHLIAQLGPFPTVLGWLEVLGAPRAFVFDGAAGPVLVAWALAGSRTPLHFGADAHVIDPRSGKSTVSSSWMLAGAPVIVTDLSPDLVDRARANRDRALPWGGDFSDTYRVTFEAPAGERGIHPLSESSLVAIDGVDARDQGVAAGHAFAIDPNFLSYDTVPLRITAEVRRTSGGAAGFNLKYESTSGTVGAGSWNSIPASDGWHTLHWDIDDARFVGMWGYHLSLDSDSTTHSQYALRRLTVEKR